MRITAALSAFFLFASFASTSRAETYAVKAAVMRAAPSPGAKAVDGVDANQTVSVMETKHSWVRVRLGVDAVGWLPADVLSDTWIKVWKRERKLLLMKGDAAPRTFRIALGGGNPTGQKVKLGDGATPEGRFFIAEPEESPGAGRYGARSMRLSYPSVADARRGLRDRLIDRNTYLAIVRAVRAGAVPPQHTPLGGSIRIHGGGGQRDWTRGCIARRQCKQKEQGLIGVGRAHEIGSASEIAANKIRCAGQIERVRERRQSAWVNETLQ